MRNQHFYTAAGRNARGEQAPEFTADTDLEERRDAVREHPKQTLRRKLCRLRYKANRAL